MFNKEWMTFFLDKKNVHSRDKYITFDEIPHIYTIKGESNYVSVTTWVHSFFEKFDAEKVINNMMKSSKWKQSPYYGKSKWDIKKEWREKGKEAAICGTKLHSDIEKYYNDIETTNESVEYSYFLSFAKAFDYLKPYRTEWMIYDEELRLAGSIDMVFWNEKNKTYDIYDWKRCKDIKKGNSFGKYGLHPVLEEVEDTNYWHYSLQLNIYKTLLERNYDMKIDECWLVCLHPEKKQFERIKVVDMSEEVNQLFEERIKKIDNH